MLAFVLGTVGAVLKVYYDYQRGMTEAAEHVAAVRGEAARPSGGSPGARPVRTGEIDRCRSRDPSRTPGQPRLRMEGPSPAVEVAKDLARRGALIALVAAMVGAIFWGTDGAVSVAYALAIVVVNFLLAAYRSALRPASRSPSWRAWPSSALIRLGLITLAVLLVRDAAWVELIPGSRSSSPILDCCLGDAFRVRLASFLG